MKAQSWTMAVRPEGEPTLDCFELVTEELAAPSEGEILVENLYLSLDPYMRGRMRDVKSYAEPLQVGEVITGETVGRVVASQSSKFAVGDLVWQHNGWRSAALLPDSHPTLGKLPATRIPLSAYLGVAGMPGRTAYFGLKVLGKPQAGETLVVSSAAGAVGSLVAQLARIAGLRVIGIAGGEEKCRFVTETVGADGCIDYKSEDIAEGLDRLCPDGIDIYFENVGGDVMRAVGPRLNKGARVPICGYISSYNATGDLNPMDTPVGYFPSLDPAPEGRFFVVTEFMEQWYAATEEITDLILAGDVKYREHVTAGFGNAPQAFIDLLNGKNNGKAVVQIGQE